MCEKAVAPLEHVHAELELIMVRALAILLAQLASAPIVSETVETAEHRPVDLGSFACRDITRSTVLRRVCYDRLQQDLVVEINGRCDRYCDVAAQTVDRLLGAPSMGQYFNQTIRREAADGRYDCRTRAPVRSN